MLNGKHMGGASGKKELHEVIAVEFGITELNGICSGL
jgi:hypothetical protein